MITTISAQRDLSGYTAGQFPEGACYRLPETFDWVRVAMERARWDIDPMSVPLGSAGGAVAWGRLLPSDYVIAEGR